MDRKFDVVIGNPPYQEEAQGDATNQMPVYHLFMDAAFDIGTKTVLITPARFLFNAGYTPKAWNAKLLNDPHLTAPIYVPDSSKLFPGTDIKGGVVVTYRNSTRTGEPIGTFTKHSELKSIVQKVHNVGGRSIASIGITNDRVYRYSQALHDKNPQIRKLMSSGNQFKIDSKAFSRLESVFFRDLPSGEVGYVKVLGLDERKKRSFRWIQADFIEGPESLHKFKVALPKASGAGKFGEILAPPLVLGPSTAVTGTFITIGGFDTEAESDACLTYVKTRFARAMLGMLKVTQDNLARVWEYVPLQDFTSASDIDWTKPIPEIDRQLYAKYGLDDDEINFIESKVQPMT